MAPSRNTLNQRSSRARRKSYIASLEERLQRYEQQGIQATQEVQVAAQKVIDENQRLKEENERLRKALDEAVSRSEELPSGSSPTAINSGRRDLNVKCRCRSCGHPTIEVRRKRPERRKLSDRNAPASQPRQQRKVPVVLSEQNISPPRNRHTSEYSSPNLTLHPGSPSHASSLICRGNEPQVTQHGSPDIPPTPSPHSLSSSPSHTQTCESTIATPPSNSACRPLVGNTMPCTQAAIIIAGMRGTHNPQEVYLDLGCPSESVSCDVDNLRVMEMMEGE